MGSFTKSHNLKKLPLGNWRSLHGYGAAHLVHGRLLLSGYDVSLHLWRDAKYDGILEANGVPFRIEIKSTGVTKDPLKDGNSEFTFTSNVRSGSQISRSAPSREKMVSTEDADFAFGVSSHDGTIWVFPVELFEVLGTKHKIFFSNIFKEKLGVFNGLQKSTIESLDIKYGFLKKSEKELEDICSNEKIVITNASKSSVYLYPWKKSARKEFIEVSYQQSLVLDIWKHIFSKF